MSFSVNGHQADASLTTLPGYEQALAKGKKLIYNRGGLRLVVDFGEGTWRATFSDAGFDPLLASRWGKARIRISVGGATVYSQEHAITDHTTKLSYRS